MTSRRVLVISNRFPPHGGAGVQRTVKFVKYLPRFCVQPFVVASRSQWTLTDTSLLDDLHDAVTITRVKGLQLPSMLSFRLRQFIARWILTVDQEAGWIPFAAAKGLEVIQDKNIDLIYSTSGPYSNHLAALVLKLKTNLAWVADFRDPWVDNLSDPFPTLLHREVCRYLEAKIMQHASRIISVSDPMTQQFARQYREMGADKFVTITNGFDPQDFSKNSLIQEARKKFTIVHAGSFYKTRTPDCFLDGIKKLLETRKIAPEDLCVRFVGNAGKAAKDAVAERNLDHVVEFTGYLPHSESVNALVSGHVLLLIVNTGANSQAVFTGKIFEYLAAKKPVLALAGPGCAAELIDSTGAGIVVPPDDADAAARGVLMLMHQWRNGGSAMCCSEDVLKHYDRRSLTGRLAEIFTQVCEESRSAP